MQQEDLLLTDQELDKLNIFLERHSKCSDNDTLVGIYNVKLVFNINSAQVPIPTVLCSTCGEEALIAEYSRYKDF